MVLEKTLESPLDCKEIHPVHPKGNQSWIFIGRTNVEAETPIPWPPDAKNWLIWKDPDAGKDWRWEETGMTEDEMVGWHHRLDGHEWVWVNSGSWWWTGRPRMLQSMGLQRVGRDWVTELNWGRFIYYFCWLLVSCTSPFNKSLNVSCRCELLPLSPTDFPSFSYTFRYNLILFLFHVIYSCLFLHKY